MVFVCPRCRREKDFGATYIPPLGRSYLCPCGQSSIVRPTWGADGKKSLGTTGTKAAPAKSEAESAPPTKPAATKPAATQAPVAVPISQVKERLATEVAAASPATTPASPPARPRAPTPPPVAASPAPATSVLAPTRPRAPTPPPAAASPAPATTVLTPAPPARTSAAPAPVERRNGGGTVSSSIGAIPAASDERPSAARSLPLGFIETGPEPDDEPVVRAPIPAALSTAPAATPLDGWALPGAGIASAGDGFAALEPTVADEEATVADDVFDVRTARDAGFAPELEPTEPGPYPADGGVPDGFDALAPAVKEAPPEPRPAPPPPSLPLPQPQPLPPPPEITRDADGGVPVDIDGTVAPPAEERPKPRPSLLRRAVFFAAKLTLALVLVGGGFVAWQYYSIRSGLPPLDPIKNYRPPVVTEVRATDGTLVGKFFEEERYVVPLEEVPEHVRKAFLAAEDAGFYQHAGIDLKSIARAVLKNLVAGKKAQGGSTISQQVARTFFLSREKTIRRKVAEIMLAREIETELSKDEIFHRYLNQIFFGKGAYGIEAAARVHFGKNVKDLTLAEGALLAGLPQAPSRYAPQSNPDAARARRSYVLREMENNGWITEAERAAADAEPLTLATIPDPTKTLSPFVTEQIRRDLIAKLGHGVVYREGLQVTATVDLAKQELAQRAVMNGRERLDKRIGYRGAAETIDLAQTTIDEAAKALGETAPAVGESATAIVEEVGSDRCYVRLPGGAKGVLHRLDNLWAYPVVPEAYFKNRKADDLTRVLKPGDVLQVTVMDPAESAGLQALKPKRRGAKPDPKIAKKIEGRLTLALVQEPDVEGALLSFTIPDGRVVAMVGGSDFAKSEFLRPMQAKRQVGSTFKTIVYAAALAKKPPPGTPKDQREKHRFTLATILQDKPIVMKAKEAEISSAVRSRRASDEDAEWKPGNSGDKYYGDTPLRTAYILSRNLPTIELTMKLGLKEVFKFARQLGIETPLAPDLSVALGSAALSLHEISRVHAVFPAGGVKVTPHFVETVVDRDGQVVFDLTQELAQNPPPKLVDPKVSYVMTRLMIDVASMGTASEIGKHLKRPSGGKTGTTNDYVDAWYVGFTPDLLTGVWVGYDQVRSLGVGETGSEAALPIWIEYMKGATDGTPVKSFVAPEGVLKVKIDRASGKLARKDQRPEEIVETWFVKGTEPTEFASAGKIKEEPNLFEIDPGLR